MKPLIYKIAIAIALFLGTFIVFKLLQRPAVYNATLKHITYTYFTYADNTTGIYKVDNPYSWRDNKNALRWDGWDYYKIRVDYYHPDLKIKGTWKYGFFPLFPLLWKVSHIGVLYIGLFNYLLFGIAVILFSIFLFKETALSYSEKICTFVVALILPPVVTYYLPYADALSTLTFALALWGLFKKKYSLFFFFILLFAMTRPMFLIVGLAFIIMEIYYLFKHRNFTHFIKELSLKLFPLLLGMIIVFLMFWHSSGTFFIYFESCAQNWNIGFSIPKKIFDWSLEGYGMNVFTIFFILIPSSILFISNFIKLLRSEKTNDLPTVFKGDLSFIKEYFLNFSTVCFWGVFLYVLFFQNGSLNGLSRYIIASPFMLIYLFGVIPLLKKIKANHFNAFTVVLSMAGLYMLIFVFKQKPSITFSDSGFFTLFLDFIFIYSMKYMKNYVKIISLSILVFYNVIWITYLYNVYLCNGWIFT
jgi:hypothetical protein